MHELAIMEGVVDAVCERLPDERISVVRLEIGALAGVDVGALRFCYEVCTHDTALAGSTLDIVDVPGRAICHACGAEHAAPSLVTPCPCGSYDRELVAGAELRLVEVEVL